MRVYRIASQSHKSTLWSKFTLKVLVDTIVYPVVCNQNRNQNLNAGSGRRTTQNIGVDTKSKYLPNILIHSNQLALAAVLARIWEFAHREAR